MIPAYNTNKYQGKLDRYVIYDSNKNLRCKFSNYTNLKYIEIMNFHAKFPFFHLYHVRLELMLQFIALSKSYLLYYSWANRWHM